MNRLFSILTIYLINITICAAQPPLPPVLKVGVERFAPPFSTMGANNSVSGFDADMLQALCKSMDRTCAFFPLPFHELLEATATGRLDLAASAIAITAERARWVNFSLPYLRIEHRILTRKDIAQNTPYNLIAMSGKTIGYEQGTILDRIVKKIFENPNIVDPKLVAYKYIEDEILALSEGTIDFVIVDNPTAIYWANNEANGLQTFGPPLRSNYYMGIAINPAMPQLVGAINEALKAYVKSGGYRENYNKYLLQFSPADNKAAVDQELP